MGYRFTRDDRTVGRALRRIAREQADAALAALGRPDADTPAAVHGLRKTVKRLRGLLRLVEPRLDAFEAEDAALRDMGRMIAGRRDAAVRLQTFRGLRPAVEGGDPAELDRIDAALAAAAGAGDHADLAALHRALTGLRDRSQAWRVRGDGFEALEPGLRRTWKRTRRAMSKASAARAGRFEAEPFHDWRKAAKAHWYQTRLLAPIWPAMMGPHEAAANELGEFLGDHNDLSVLVDVLHADGDTVGTAALAALDSAALAARQGLADRALDLGGRLFAGGARPLARRWGRWWDLWRAQR
jgi:CHAD domain-containing protein